MLDIYWSKFQVHRRAVGRDIGGRGSNVFAQEENHLFGGLGGGADVECDLDVRGGQMVVVVLGWVLKC